MPGEFVGVRVTFGKVRDKYVTRVTGLEPFVRVKELKHAKEETEQKLRALG